MNSLKSIVLKFSFCSIIFSSVVSCGIPPQYFIQFVRVAGQVAIDTSVGLVLEKTLDWATSGFLGSNEEKNSNPLNVIPFRDKPLLGYVTNPLKYEIGGNRHGNSKTMVTIPTELMRFQRMTTEDPWFLTYETREIINKRVSIGSIQLSLQDLGYKPGRVDGINGRRTKGAIKAFQKARNLYRKDGQLDQATRNALMIK